VDNTKELRAISFCSGYGGIERGLAIAGVPVRIVAYVEIEAYAVQNLVEKMESAEMDKAPIYTNLKTFPLGHFLGKVDLIIAGFPCQPFSAAGKREADEDPRHLFPFLKEFARILGCGKILFENVAGIATARIGGDGWADPEGTPILLHVCRELERIGYRVTPVLQSAEGVGAPHLRERFFIFGELAYTSEQRLQGHARDEYGKGWKFKWTAGSASKESILRGTKWPARPGQEQHEWEHQRTI
jgi:DNA (cytosine-5)-methyltransferase 1